MATIKTTGKVYLPKSAYKTRVPQNQLGRTAIDGDTYAELDLEVRESLGGLKAKVVEIGDWDMDASVDGDQNLAVPHGLPATAKIRRVEAVIRNDADTDLYMLPYFDGVNMQAAVTTADATVVNIITRPLGPVFDTTDFDTDTDFNRGWITIWYTED